MLSSAHDLVCRKKADPLDSISYQYLTPSSSVHEVPCRPFFTCSSHSLVRSRFERSPDPAGSFWLRGNAITHGVLNCLPFSERMMQSSVQQKHSSFEYHRNVPNEPSHESTRATLLINGQPRRRPEHPPGSNTRFCLNFVSITFLQQERTSWLELLWRVVVQQLFLFSVFSKNLQWEKYCL